LKFQKEIKELSAMKHLMFILPILFIVSLNALQGTIEEFEEYVVSCVVSPLPLNTPQIEFFLMCNHFNQPNLV
jgi:hypothetical protein